MRSCQVNVQVVQTLPSDIQPNDSMSLIYFKSQRSSNASSRLSIKIKEAKVEKAIAELRLTQLKKRMELQAKCDTMLREQELMGENMKLNELHVKRKS